MAALISTSSKFIFTRMDVVEVEATKIKVTQTFHNHKFIKIQNPIPLTNESSL